MLSKEQLIDLKNEVIRAFKAHELGQELLMSDKLYDSKLAIIKQNDPEFNIFDYQEFNPDEEGRFPHRSGLVDLEKTHIHNIEDYWKPAENGEHNLPKWDGSSIAIYYTNGRLSHILSMSDKEYGIDKTERFKSFVPHKVSDNISIIRCECLIDVRDIDNARGKANGLVNSKYLEDEIEQLACLVAFSGIDLNGNKIPYEELREALMYKFILRDNGRPYFICSKLVEELQLLERGVAGFQDSHYDYQFAIDGVVNYEQNTALKYDYISSAISEVIDVHWNETEREGFFPVLEIDPVELEGKTITNPSTNGLNNYINQRLGLGAKVEVAFSGTTIPKVVGILEEAEPTLPKCPYCGRQLRVPDDQYGSVLKCSNPHCEGKLNLRRGWLEGIEDWYEPKDQTVYEHLSNNLEAYLLRFLNLARWNYEDKKFGSFNKNLIEQYILDNNVPLIQEQIYNNYKLSELQSYEFELNLPATVQVLSEVMNKYKPK